MSINIFKDISSSALAVPGTLLGTAKEGATATTIKIPKLVEKTVIKKYEQKDKWYLKDLCLLGLVDTLFTMSQDIDDEKNLILLHKNKHRKEVKKIVSISSEYSNLRKRLITALSDDDQKRLSKLTRGFAPTFFKLAQQVKGINLETVCVNIIVARFQKRQNIHKDFEICKDFKKLFKIVEQVEKVGLVNDEGTQEYLFATQIVQKINEYKL